MSDTKWDAILTKAEQYARGLAADSDDESESGDLEDGDTLATSGRATMEDCDDEDEDEDEDVEMGDDDEGTGADEY